MEIPIIEVWITKALESVKVQAALKGKTIVTIVFKDEGKTKLINFVTQR